MIPLRRDRTDQTERTAATRNFAHPHHGQRQTARQAATGNPSQPTHTVTSIVAESARQRILMPMRVHHLRLSPNYLVKRLRDEAWPGLVVPADFFGTTPDRSPGGLRGVLIIEYRNRQAIAGFRIQ
jgi:hypothetical protein